MSNTDSRLLILLLSRRDTLSESEAEALAGLNLCNSDHAHGETIVAGGDADAETVSFVVSGMALRAQVTLSGAEVISAVHVPGDFVDLHGLVLERLDHSVRAQGACRVQRIEKRELSALFREYPRLARVFWKQTLIETKIHRAWLAAGATLRANERIAHFVCELHARYAAIGLVRGNSFPMPLEQKDLDSLFGLSRAHANRAVQELRARGLLEWTRGTIAVTDLEGLRRLGKFDGRYLELGPRRRAD